jgi:hypothetical protein
MTILSHLVLSPDADDPLSTTATALRNMNQEEFNGLVALANCNHVIVRGLKVYREIMLAVQDPARAELAAAAIENERARIGKAIGFLRMICDAFDEAGLDVTVMKTLDHWPDFGSDMDLYTNASTQVVCSLMQRRFGAQIASRSWGDRLACKWNFDLPGLSAPVEIHMGRLGQTGEQLVLASRLLERSRRVEIEGHAFRVPSASDRIMISTLQRMYRHFYFRLCDIVDSATLAASGELDYEELRTSAQAAGIWEGVATYLVIVSDYVSRYTGKDIGLPRLVKDSAHFDGAIVYVGGSFIRVPILPQSARLYRSQFTRLLCRRELQSSARLALLPGLATAAAIGHKITGSDKGIW